MSKPKILIQLDSDRAASVFDAVVAVDSGVDQLLQYSEVDPARVRELVHGAMFTRGPEDLKNTAVFVGGSNVGAGERLLAAVTDCFFGPLRVSVMLDANGANTTAAAAVLAAGRHVSLSGIEALVLAGTGPVGQRAVQLLARAGASVRVGSRSKEKAEAVCARIRGAVEGAKLAPFATGTAEQLSAALEGIRVVIAAGAAGALLLPSEARTSARELQVAIDLNAVPPLGIEGLEVTDKAANRDGVICYGAIGVGATKMKIHKAAIARLFQANDLVLDADEIYAIGTVLEAERAASPPRPR